MIAVKQPAQSQYGKMDLIISHSHYLIVSEDGKYLLVDTGSPISFCGGCERMTLSIGGMEYSIRPDDAMIMEINRSGLIPEKIDVLLGMDVLKNHCFEFDKTGKKVLVDTSVDETQYNHSVPLETISVMGKMAVGMTVDINGVSIKSILDTGAWISYLSSAHLSGVEVTGSVEDYNPMLGSINTTKHIIGLSLGDFRQNIVVAKMPKMLEMMMSLLGVDLVLGLDAIDCKRICLDFKSNEVRL